MSKKAGPSRKYLSMGTSPRSMKETTVRVLRYVIPHRGHLVAACVWVLFGSALGAAVPGMTGRIIDVATSAARAHVGVPSALWQLAGLLIGAGALSWFATRKQIISFGDAGVKAVYDLRNEIIIKQQEIDVAFLESTESGDLLSRLNSDAKQVDSFFTGTLRRFVAAVASLVLTFVAMVLFDWRLALVTFVVVGMMLGVMHPFSRALRKAYVSRQRTVADVSTLLAEELDGMKVAQAYNRTAFNLSRFEQRNAANRDAQVDAAFVSIAFPSTLEVVFGFAVAGVIGIGGYLSLAQLVSIGTLVAFITYSRQFFKQTMNTSSLYADLQSALASAERLFEILDVPVKVFDPADPYELETVRGQIEFRDVHFSYEGGRGSEALRGINLRIESGETVAIVGRTGAGKTTLAGLVARFYDPTAGAVLIDGHDLRTVSLASLRANLGFVLQEPVLFDGTIAENIRWGRPDATDDEVRAAANAAGVLEFVESTASGFETQVGSRGTALSVGQRQLVSIARAFIRQPAILVMDEATSSVDTRTEAIAAAALLEAREGRTTLIIAHRESTIRSADRVVTLESGRLVEPQLAGQPPGEIQCFGTEKTQTRTDYFLNL